MSLIAAIFTTLLSACGGKSPSAPSSPTPTPTPTATRIIALNGDLAFGSVEVGSSATRTLSITNSGNSTLTITGMTITAGLGELFASSWTNGTIAAGGSQQATIRFTPTAAQSYNGTLTVTGDHTAGTNTIAVSGTGIVRGPRTQFGTGTYLVGTDIAAGRYYNDPASGCYWERLSGLGGSISDIIANEFISFNAGQWIVDILSSDKAFKTDAECATWYRDSPRAGLQTGIRPGMWLVGAQIAPGTYRTTASSGCYWERLRNFEGVLASIITNDFVSSAGPIIVTISAGDVGFSADDDCGQWTLTTLSPATVTLQSFADINRNRLLNRQQQGSRR